MNVFQVHEPVVMPVCRWAGQASRLVSLPIFTKGGYTPTPRRDAGAGVSVRSQS